jgi:hypothetical protein
VLRQLQQHTGSGALLFPSWSKTTQPIGENTIPYALYRMGYHSRATGHGFRATAFTILNELGFPADVIERQLAHTRFIEAARFAPALSKRLHPTVSLRDHPPIRWSRSRMIRAAVQAVAAASTPPQKPTPSRQMQLGPCASFRWWPRNACGISDSDRVTETNESSLPTNARASAGHRHYRKRGIFSTGTVAFAGESKPKATVSARLCPKHSVRGDARVNPLYVIEPKNRPIVFQVAAKMLNHATPGTASPREALPASRTAELGAGALIKNAKLDVGRQKRWSRSAGSFPTTEVGTRIR